MFTPSIELMKRYGAKTLAYSTFEENGKQYASTILMGDDYVIITKSEGTIVHSTAVLKKLLERQKDDEHRKSVYDS